MHTLPQKSDEDLYVHDLATLSCVLSEAKVICNVCVVDMYMMWVFVLMQCFPNILQHTYKCPVYISMVLLEGTLMK